MLIELQEGDTLHRIPESLTPEVYTRLIEKRMEMDQPENPVEEVECSFRAINNARSATNPEGRDYAVLVAAVYAMRALEVAETRKRERERDEALADERARMRGLTGTVFTEGGRRYGKTAAMGSEAKINNPRFEGVSAQEPERDGRDEEPDREWVVRMHTGDTYTVRGRGPKYDPTLIGEPFIRIGASRFAACSVSVIEPVESDEG